MYPSPQRTRSTGDLRVTAANLPPTIPGGDPALSWQDESALCRQADPDMWFPEAGNPKSTSGPMSAMEQYSWARKVCRRCPLQRPCLTYALTTERDERGVWGGTGHRTRQDARTRIRHGQSTLAAEVEAELGRAAQRRAA